MFSSSFSGGNPPFRKFILVSRPARRSVRTVPFRPVHRVRTF